MKFYYKGLDLNKRADILGRRDSVVELNTARFGRFAEVLHKSCAFAVLLSATVPCTRNTPRSICSVYNSAPQHVTIKP